MGRTGRRIHLPGPGDPESVAGTGRIGRGVLLCFLVALAVLSRGGPVCAQDPSPEFVRISAYTHTLALDGEGTVWAWGQNNAGQLGDGTTTDRPWPEPVPNLPEIVDVSAGWWYSLALDAQGNIWAWGSNQYGKLGIGSWINEPETVPVRIQGVTGVVSIRAGFEHSLALLADGTVRSWGRNTYGTLGDGTTTGANAPGVVPDLLGVTAIDSGSWHSLALRHDGTVWSWGFARDGQLGIGWPG